MQPSERTNRSWHGRYVGPPTDFIYSSGGFDDKSSTSEKYWRIVAFRAVVLATLLVVAMFSISIFMLPTKADNDAQSRLLGKWGLYLPKSNWTAPFSVQGMAFRPSHFVV